MRGDGHLHPSFQGSSPISVTGGHSYDDTFIRKLITGDPSAVPKSDESPIPKYRVYNLHLATMGGSDNEVLELVEFALRKGGSIEERIYKKNPISNNTDVEIYTINPNSPPVSKLHQTTTSWVNSVNSIIPSGYTSYLFFFPMVLYFTPKVWDRGIREGTPIYGYINGMETSPISPYGPVKSGRPDVVDPITLAASFVKGEKELLDGPPTSGTVSTDSSIQSYGAPMVTSKPTSTQVGFETLTTTGLRDEIRIPTATCSNLGYNLYPLPRY